MKKRRITLLILALCLLVVLPGCSAGGAANLDNETNENIEDMEVTLSEASEDTTNESAEMLVETESQAENEAGYSNAEESSSLSVSASITAEPATSDTQSSAAASPEATNVANAKTEPSRSIEPAQEAVSTSESVPTLEITPEPTLEATPEPTPLSKYKDGTYSGSGSGFNGKITVSVTVASDEITRISVTSHLEDAIYMSEAEGVISSIISAQSTGVSAVSGATYSSKGILSAVDNALQNAQN